MGRSHFQSVKSAKFADKKPLISCKKARISRKKQVISAKKPRVFAKKFEEISKNLKKFPPLSYLTVTNKPIFPT